jgi:hypothetical protein
MHYVYIVESVSVPGHFYIGSTDNLRQRLRQRQADVDAHAAKYRPRKLETYLAFEQKATVVRFELDTGDAQLAFDDLIDAKAGGDHQAVAAARQRPKCCDWKLSQARRLDYPDLDRSLNP